MCFLPPSTFLLTTLILLLFLPFLQALKHSKISMKFVFEKRLSLNANPSLPHFWYFLSYLYTLTLLLYSLPWWPQYSLLQLPPDKSILKFTESHSFYHIWVFNLLSLQPPWTVLLHPVMRVVLFAILPDKALWKGTLPWCSFPLYSTEVEDETIV